MKKTFIIMVVSIVAATGSPAQASSRIGYLASFGISLPISPYSFSSFWAEGMSLAAGAGYAIKPPLTLFALINYQRFPHEGFALLNPAGHSYSGGQRFFLGPSVGIKAVPSPNRKVFFAADVGVLRRFTRDITYRSPDTVQVQKGYSNIGFSVSLGPGYSFRLAKGLDFVIQGKFQSWVGAGESAQTLSAMAGVLF